MGHGRRQKELATGHGSPGRDMDHARAGNALRDAMGNDANGTYVAWQEQYEAAELVPELSGALVRSSRGYTWHIVRLAGRTTDALGREVWGARADCSWFTDKPLFATPEDRYRNMVRCARCVPNSPRPCLASRDRIAKQARRA